MLLIQIINDKYHHEEHYILSCSYNLLVSKDVRKELATVNARLLDIKNQQNSDRGIHYEKHKILIFTALRHGQLSIFLNITAVNAQDGYADHLTCWLRHHPLSQSRT